jgi:hypothetical protein
VSDVQDQPGDPKPDRLENIWLHENHSWGEYPMADAPLHSLFSQHETQKLLPEPKIGRCITGNS